jgi:hypothetical protein
MPEPAEEEAEQPMPEPAEEEAEQPMPEPIKPRKPDAWVSWYTAVEQEEAGEEVQPWNDVVCRKPPPAKPAGAKKPTTKTTFVERQTLTGVCWNCLKPGHSKNFCPLITGHPPPDVSFTNTTKEHRDRCMAEGKCFHCGSTKHLAKRCPSLGI